MQSWNCVLEDCKVAKIIDIAMLRCWERAGKRRYQGGEKPPTVRRTVCCPTDSLPPAGRKGTFDKAERVESAFALLSQKVTKAMRRFRRSLPDREKGKILKRTISVMTGKGSVNHNSRKFHAKNTDPERSCLNVEYCNENIKDVYHELFDEALARYNEKQTRNDRIIND